MIDENLPQGWERTTLGNVIILSKKKIEPSECPEAKYLSLKHIESVTNRISDCGQAVDVKSTKSVFKNGDILYGRLRPYLNKVCQPYFNGICSTDILVFSGELEMDNSFLLFFLSQPAVVRYATLHSSGINLPRVSFTTLGKKSIDIPPHPEQKRIATKINTLQAKSRKAREALAAARPLLDKLRQSILAAAFRGDLTADWRKQNPDVEPASKLLQRIRTERCSKWEQAELAKMRAKGKEPKNDKWKAKYKEPEPVDTTGLPKLPDRWCWVSFGELVEQYQNGLSKRKGREGDALPVLRLADIVDGKAITQDNIRTINLTKNEEEKYHLHNGDLICIRVNGSAELVGRLFVFSDESYWAFCDHFIRIRILDSFVNPQYVAAVFSSLSIRQTIEQLFVSSAGQKTISQGTLSAIPVPLAPQEEQLKLTKLVQQADNFLQDINKQLSLLAKQNINLDKSILAKAFRGELVPQDPNDEPASILLERIKAEREAAKPKKTKRKTKPRKRNNNK